MGLQGDAAEAGLLVRAPRRAQLRAGEDGRDHDLHLELGEGGAQAATHAATEWDPGVAVGCNGLVLREHNLGLLQSALQRNELDVVLVPAVGASDGLRCRAIDSEPLRYITAGGAIDSEPSAEEPIELADLMRQVQVLVADECGLTRFVRRMFDEHGAQLDRYAGEAHSYSNLVEWARLGLGGAVLPASRLDATTGRGRPLVENGDAIAIEYEAQWLATSPRGEAIETLLDNMLEPAATAAPGLGG